MRKPMISEAAPNGESRGCCRMFDPVLAMRGPGESPFESTPEGREVISALGGREAVHLRLLASGSLACIDSLSGVF